MNIKPFEIVVGDEALADLRLRLSLTRFTTPSDSTYWAGGTDPGYLRELVSYWQDGYDWRATERRLNSYAHYLADVDGQSVHFVLFRAVREEGAPAPLPLVMTHGWPSSFVEMLRAAERLADPGRFGGDPADAFDVVVPSLPGFLFSEPLKGLFTRRAVAELWHRLMTEVLGYERYAAFGGDIGGGVTQWIGALYPEAVVGVHITSAVVTSDFSERPISPEEQAYLDHMAAYDAQDQGYSEIMCTRPDTVAAALGDSPAGLLAWIIDKYRDWSDCQGDLERSWDRDTLLTVATLYWVTDSIGTSFRQYYDYGHNKPIPKVTVPAGVTLSNEPGFKGLPRSLPERIFADLRHFATPERGGHFMSHEEPEQVARVLREFFRPLR